MPTSNLGLVGAYGASAGGDALQEILKRRALEAYQQEQIANQRRAQALAEARNEEDRRQFDIQTGQRNQTFDLERRRFDFETTPKPDEGTWRENLLGPDGKPIAGLINRKGEFMGPTTALWKPPEKPPSPGSIEQQIQDAHAAGNTALENQLLETHKKFQEAGARPFAPYVTLDENNRLTVVDRAGATAVGVTRRGTGGGGGAPPPGASVTPGQAVPGAGRGATPPGPAPSGRGAGPGPGGGGGGEPVYGKPTTEQLKDAGYYRTGKASTALLDEYEDKVTESDVLLIQNSPLPDAVDNSLLSAAGQKYRQALRDFTTAKLRRDSGAAINHDEWVRDGLTVARQFNDVPELAAQKRNTRYRVVQSMGISAGPALRSTLQEPDATDTGGGGGSGTVKMRGPTGQIKDVPASEVDYWIKKGATVVKKPGQ